MNEDIQRDPPPETPRRRRVTSLAQATPFAVFAALSAAPLALATPIGTSLGAPDTALILADDCDTGLTSGALGLLKWPQCAGD
jgi:hypothetical protein